MRRGTRRVLCLLTVVSLFLTVISIYMLHQNAGDLSKTDQHLHPPHDMETFPAYDYREDRKVNPKFKPVMKSVIEQVSRHDNPNIALVRKDKNDTELVKTDKPVVEPAPAVVEPEPEPEPIKDSDHKHEEPLIPEKKDLAAVPGSKISKIDPAIEKAQVEPAVPKLNYNLHTFYYPWYGHPTIDNGTYLHWNHEYLQHWNKKEADKWPKGKHIPPLDIGSDFYPKLGPYSSRNISVIKQHMQWIKDANIGVVCVSWYPKGLADGQGRQWEDIIIKIMEIADQFAIKVTFHLEPYESRTVATIRNDIEYIVKTYAKHNAMYYYQHQGVKKMLLYIYDSYLIGADDWKRLLTTNGNMTIRGSDFDAYIIGLIVKEGDRMDVVKAGFDGAYTYFASDGFSYGSTSRNWPSLRVFAKKNKLIFIPCVGPGYVDIRVRPWNNANTKARNNGEYYNNSFTAAINSQADLIAITSFNEWHEGTQIEPAVPKMSSDGFTYQDYSPNSPQFYLNLTATWSNLFAAKLEELYGAKEQKLLIAAAGV